MTAKPPLLLLHGVTMSASAWDDVAPLLSHRFELIVPTAAGHRGGPSLQGTASIRALIDVTEQLLDERGLQTVHIAGNSMGGWMAIELARRGRARSVCALSPAGFWTSGSRDATEATDRIRRVQRLTRATRFIAPMALRLGTVRRIAMRDIAQHADRLTTNQALESMLDLFGCDAADELLGTSESVATLDPLPCPITLAWAERDRILPAAIHGVTAQRRLPQATYAVLPGVGHVPMIDDPALCAQIIVDSTTSPSTPS
jgi:pimeloyl-ACP methyl ester carboxylesterase